MTKKVLVATSFALVGAVGGYRIGRYSSHRPVTMQLAMEPDSTLAEPPLELMRVVSLELLGGMP